MDKSSEKTIIFDIAPPYLNNNLHIGHIYQYCLWYVMYKSLNYSDLTSAHKECPIFLDLIKENPIYRVKCTLGLDVNGLPLVREAKKRFPQLNYAKGCESLIQLYKPIAQKRFKQLGLYELNPLEYQTNDPIFKQLVEEAYFKIQPRISDQLMPQFYCPNCKTVVSHSQVERVPEDKLSYYFNLSDAEGSTYSIMTTQPKYLFGIQGVVFNPKDPRYTKLKGKSLYLKIPELNLNLQISTYESVKVRPDVGTGLLYITLWADHLDLELARELNLKGTHLYDSKGEITSSIYNFSNLSYDQFFQSDLFDSIFTKGPLRKQVKTLRHTERSDCKAEIKILNSQQVTVSLDPLTKDLLKEKIAHMVLNPLVSKETLLKNVDTLANWCISRGQEYYSFLLHRGKQFKVDTWFVSALTPLIMEKILDSPFQVWRLQGSQIIRTWALYSVYMHLFMAKNGFFNKIFVHRHIKDQLNQKISKSKGNGPVLEPLLEPSNLPILRYYFCQKPLERDFPFKSKELSDIKLYFNKVWNLNKKINSLDLHSNPNNSKQDSLEEQKDLLSYNQILNRFKKYYCEEVPLFNLSSMFHYVKYLVYDLSSKVQGSKFFSEEGDQLDMLHKVFGLVKGFFKAVDFDL